MKIYCGNSNKTLVSRMDNILLNKNDSDYLIDISDRLKIEKFADGEILPSFTESIRGKDIFFLQTTDTSDSIMETLLVVDAAKRAGVKSFTLISPYMGYSRQDKSDHIRSSIGSKMLSDILEKVGVNRLMTIDLHSSSIQGFYNIPVIHLNGGKIFSDYVKSLNLDNIVVCSPDNGAVKRNADFAKNFPDSTFAVVNKKRIKPNEIHSMELIGSVRGKNVIIFDDIIDTGNTLAKASDLLFENGALSVRAIATHGLLSGKAIDIINNSSLTELIVSDTIESVYLKELKSNKISVISCDELITNSIDRLLSNKSISELNLI